MDGETRFSAPEGKRINKMELLGAQVKERKKRHSPKKKEFEENCVIKNLSDKNGE